MRIINLARTIFLMELTKLVIIRKFVSSNAICLLTYFTRTFSAFDVVKIKSVHKKIHKCQKY